MKDKKLIPISLWILLFVGILLEIGLQTFWKNIFGIYVSPIIWMLAGFAISFSAFGLIGFNKKESSGNPTNKIVFTNTKRKYLKYILFFTLFILTAYWCGNFLAKTFDRIPIDAKTSDIIPSLQMYVNRLLNGEVVYRPLQFEGYHVDPTYLPLLWMPYAFSELLDIDYRWTAYLLFIIAIFIYQLKLLKQNVPNVELFVKTIIPFVWVYLYTQFDSGSLGLAVELLPVGFYLLLTLSIFNRNPWIMAFGIILCLLSRYAFTFWLPVYLIIYWCEAGFKNVFKVSLLVSLGVLFIYIIPFLSKDWTILSKGLDYYQKTAVGQWKPQPDQRLDEKPFHLSQGLSVAIYFYDYNLYSVEDRLSLNRKVHIIVCGITALLLLLGYFYFRKKGLNVRIYLLIGLKVYLVIFYGFFYVPFSYLFQLPLFLSIAILNNISFVKKESELLIRD